MRRSRVVRFELLLLAAITLLLVFRAVQGSRPPQGTVAFSDLEARQLRQATIELTQPARLAIDATGSVARAHGRRDAELAAYAWVVRRGSGDVVWRMQAADAKIEHGTLAQVQDTLSLPAGRYDVYFTAYGNSFQDRHARSLLRRVIDPDQHWQNDQRDWQVVVQPAGEAAAVRALAPRELDAEAAAPGQLWSCAPMRNHAKADYMFEVTRPVEVEVYAIGEIGRHPMDYGWIENAATGERIWEMTRDNTRPAGGVEENRMVRETLRLMPGIYQAAYTTDPGHAFDAWRANPPWDPRGWGLTLTLTDPLQSAYVSPFDPWKERAPLVRLDRVGSDAHHTVQFKVEEPLQVMVHSVGEIVGSDRYDYGWLENDRTEEKVWEMSAKASHHAGGARKNQAETAFLNLTPGTYTLHYQTDGSHAFGDWNSAEPSHPERWGVALFPIGASPGAADVAVLQERRIDEAKQGIPAPPAAPVPPPGSSKVLVQKTRVGNDAHVEIPFELDRRTSLRIVALGEITLRERYDYGEIKHAGTGETAWEMSWQNTVAAGGDDRNRRFDGLVTLDAGAYVLRYFSDATHAYGNFGKHAPDQADNWGIALYLQD